MSLKNKYINQIKINNWLQILLVRFWKNLFKKKKPESPYSPNSLKNLAGGLINHLNLEGQFKKVVKKKKYFNLS